MAKKKQFHKARKTKHRTKDIDEIVNDLKPDNIVKINNRVLDENLPGLGQFYCVFCSRYFVNKDSLTNHYRGKEHKKQIKRTKEEPYSIKESKFMGGQEG